MSLCKTEVPEPTSQWPYFEQYGANVDPGYMPDVVFDLDAAALYRVVHNRTSQIYSAV